MNNEKSKKNGLPLGPIEQTAETDCFAGLHQVLHLAVGAIESRVLTEQAQGDGQSILSMYTLNLIHRGLLGHNEEPAAARDKITAAFAVDLATLLTGYDEFLSETQTKGQIN